MNDDVHHPQASIHISATKHLHTRKRFRFKCLAEYVFSIVHMENAGLLEEEEEEERGGGRVLCKVFLVVVKRIRNCLQVRWTQTLSIRYKY